MKGCCGWRSPTVESPDAAAAALSDSGRGCRGGVPSGTGHAVPLHHGTQAQAIQAWHGPQDLRQPQRDKATAGIPGGEGIMRKRGEGSIARIRRGIYKVRVSTGVIDGKRHQHEEIVHGTHEDAIRVLAQHSIQRRPRAYGETVEHFLNRWITDHVVKTKRGSTLNNHLRNVSKHIVPLIGRKQLLAVGPGDVETIMDAVTGKGLGSGRVPHVRATLGAAWDWGVKSQRIPGLVNVVRMTYSRPVEQREMKVLDEEQLRTYVDQVSDDSDAGFFLLGAFCGLRIR